MKALAKETCKAARALLNWKADDLSNASGVSIDTLRSFESGRSRTLSRENEAAIRAGFESAGIQFLENGEVANGEGVAIRVKQQDE